MRGWCPLFTLLLIPILNGSHLSAGGVGKVLVDFIAKNPKEAWIAKALEHNVYKDLGDYPQLIPTEKDTLPYGNYCAPSELNCRLKFYHRNGVQIVILGAVKYSRLYFSVFDATTGARVGRGTILPGPQTSLQKIRLQIFYALKVFIEKGGKLEQWGSRTIPPPPPPELSLWTSFLLFVEKERYSFQFLLLIMLVGIFIFPAIIWFMLRIGQRKLKKQRVRLGWWALAFVGGVGAILAYLFLGTGPLQILLGRNNPGWPFYILGGAAWSVMCWISLRFIFQRLYGLELAPHLVIVSLIKAYFISSLLRILFLALLISPFVGLVWLAAATFNISTPGVGCLFLFWLYYVIESLSLALDGEYVLGDATENNPWHKAMEALARRVEIQQGVHFREKGVLFLPTEGWRILTYGGGLSKPRILVGMHFLRLSFGASVADPESYSTRGLGKSGEDYWLHRPFELNPYSVRTEHEKMGLPMFHDYLVGILLHEMGHISRKSNIIFTLSLTLERMRGQVPKLFRNIFELMAEFYRSQLSSFSETLLDWYVATHSGLHHLMQYLYLVGTGYIDFLTQQAKGEDLDLQSRQILVRLVELQSLPTWQGPTQALPKSRLAWLSKLIYSPISDVKPLNIHQIIFRISLGTICLGLLTFQVLRAIHYHPIYTARITEQAQKIQEGIKP